MNETNAIALIEKHAYIILFDGVCHLCSNNVQFIFKRDKTASIMFCPVQSDTGKFMLQHFCLPTDQHESVVFIENGQAFLKSDAVIHMWQHLQFPWPMLTLVKFCPVFIRDAIYLIIARNRYRWFGKRGTCMMPDSELTKRFIH
ncbi:MAG TPA: thiol-disulfide oxidoreductase DCC family protein [Pseudomonadales bacterium]|nr:thiol-disulfide oxidoreductase DCC family protein [Pseudomonadales bacterium]